VRAVQLDGANLLGPIDGPLMLKVRSMAPLAQGWIEGDMLRFAEPQFGVAPGQAAVAYIGDRLVAGGTMVATVAAEPGLIPA
jgi:tRNA-uridine 2-sulfurtransferase